MKATGLFLGDKVKKILFLVVSRSDVHTKFYFVRLIFVVPDRVFK